MFNKKQLSASLILAIITVVLIIIISLTQHLSELSPLLAALWLASKTYPITPFMILGVVVGYFWAAYYVLMRIINFVVRLF